MKHRTLFLLQAIAFAVAGLGALLAPQQFFAAYGAELNEPGVALTRLYGATVLMAAIIFWLARASGPSEARRALVIGALAGNILAILSGLMAAFSGTFNAIIWASIGLWLLFAIAFAYLLIRQPEADLPPAGSKAL